MNALHDGMYDVSCCFYIIIHKNQLLRRNMAHARLAASLLIMRWAKQQGADRETG